MQCELTINKKLTDNKSYLNEIIFFKRITTFFESHWQVNYIDDNGRSICNLVSLNIHIHYCNSQNFCMNLCLSLHNYIVNVLFKKYTFISKAFKS